jgi:hypothetical protein
MPAIPTVTITLSDNGASAALAVPQARVQLKIGCAVGGVVNQPYATMSPTSLQTQFVGGPLVEAGGLVCAAGNVVIAISCPIVTKGAKLSGTTATVASAKNVGTAVITTTLDTTFGAWDTAFWLIKCVTAGTIGTGPGPSVIVSRDAGRNFGAPLSLGSALFLDLGAPLNTLTPGGSGVELNFTTAQTMAVGDTWTFGTVAPQWNDAGVAAAYAAFFASQYAIEGIGSSHVVGVMPINGGSGASDIAIVQSSLQTGTVGFVYARAIVDLQDAMGGGPGGATWGGSAETEAAWMTRLSTITSGATADPRVCADGGHYNTPSAYACPDGGLPAYRRPLSWTHAVRRTQIPLQQRAGRVRTGPYQGIVVSPAVDPTDGFVYHDERVNPGLNAARLGSAMTWPKKGQGFFQCQEPLLSAPGSQFTELGVGNLLDAACDIAYATGVEEVSDDLLCQKSGALDPLALNALQGEIQTAEDQGLVANKIASSVNVTVDPLANVLATGIIPTTVSVTGRAYVNGMAFTIGLNNGAGGQ